MRPLISERLDLVGPPDYGDETLPLYGLVVPGGAAELSLSGPILRTADAWTLLQMEAAGHHLFLYGYVEYEDLSGQLHRSSFNFRYGPVNQNIFVNAGDDSYWTYS